MHVLAAHFNALLLLACSLCGCRASSISASEDYDGLVPALNRSFSCLDAALLAQTLECREVSTPSGRTSVERCSKGSGSGSGLFVLCSKRRCRNGEVAEDQQGEGMLGQDVFRIRLTGPEIHLLDILYCERDLAYAQYALAEPGSYHAEVRSPQCRQNCLCKTAACLPSQAPCGTFLLCGTQVGATHFPRFPAQQNASACGVELPGLPDKPPGPALCRCCTFLRTSRMPRTRPCSPITCWAWRVLRSRAARARGWRTMRRGRCRRARTGAGCWASSSGVRGRAMVGPCTGTGRQALCVAVCCMR